MREGGELVFVAVGANLGDREGRFAAVIEALEAEPDLVLLAASTVYETDPIGPGEQAPYLNAVLGLRSWLAPLELLRRLQRIEALLGRDRSASAIRFGPRTIDLDLLFFGDRVIELPELVVPHPRAHERAFVLMPLAEIAPALVHPRLGTTIDAIARSLFDPQAVRPWRRPAGWPGAASEAGLRG
ncbi:2-amino-4-hydroxy-6-hydroxymethyldihydropteridine diphosphokinase [Myxococcota bacterium]|nr:2-amino-4-hydroxy-6-hydroxymethyldihydropteridine diphosphokinase [Myxococcota bacterium]